MNEKAVLLVQSYIKGTATVAEQAMGNVAIPYCCILLVKEVTSHLSA